MGLEIERKWLVEGDAWKSQVSRGSHIRQGYLSFGGDGANEVRVRIENSGDGAPAQACLTIKSAGGLVRREEEVGIPLAQAEQLLNALQGALIEKTRWRVAAASGQTIEIDEYAGALAGLVVAECEFTQVDEAFSGADFLGEEITEAETGYRNADLARWGLPNARRKAGRPGL